MRSCLKRLYENNQDRFKEVVDQCDESLLSDPLLMSPNKEYQKQNVKILIIRQQTNGWNWFSDDIESGMKSYEIFNLGKNCYTSPFWNIAKKVASALSNSDSAFAWTNLNKYDVNEDKPAEEYMKSISNLDGILLEEINIIAPNVVLFFTGPNFDVRIKNIFNGIDFKSAHGFEQRTFAKLNHPHLPCKSFRTYHPNYLRLSGLENQVVKFLCSCFQP